MAVKIIIIKHFNPDLKIGLEDVRNAWLLDGRNPIKLSVQVHRGVLVYRLPESGKRVSFTQLKKGLVSRKIIIEIQIPTMPF